MPPAAFALAAIGRDRPGIVAAVARVLYELGCNVEDSSMTLLRGNFAMMLIVGAPTGRSASDIEAALRPTCETMGLTFSVREVDDRSIVAEPTHVLTVYGADRPGILFRTCDVLAAAGVNITDLNSRLVGEEHPVYALTLELELPHDASVDELDERLRAVAQEIGVDLDLHERDADVL